MLQIKSDIEIILSLKVDFNFTPEFQESEGIFYINGKQVDMLVSLDSQ